MCLSAVLGSAMLTVAIVGSSGCRERPPRRTYKLGIDVVATKLNWTCSTTRVECDGSFQMHNGNCPSGPYDMRPAYDLTYRFAGESNAASVWAFSLSTPSTSNISKTVTLTGGRVVLYESEVDGLRIELQ